MKKRKLKDMSDDELDKDILVRENLEVKRKLMRMTEEMEYLRKEMEKLKEEQRDRIVPTMNAKRVAECLPMDMCIELIDEALEDFESKKCQQPLRFGYRLPLKDKKRLKSGLKMLRWRARLLIFVGYSTYSGL